MTLTSFYLTPTSSESKKSLAISQLLYGQSFSTHGVGLHFVEINGKPSDLSDDKFMQSILKLIFFSIILL